MKTRSVSFVALVVTALLAGCGGGGGSSSSSTPPPSSNNPPPPPPPFSASVSGAVQKGPFLVGSTVLINKLDSAGKPTDSTIVAQIKDSVGSFTFSPTSAGPVQIVANGYYFSELTGQISSGTLTLRGLYNVDSTATQTAYVNIMTHLIHNRVLALVGQGITMTNALAQAQQEFVTAFAPALPTANLAQFSAMSVYNSTGTNDASNAYLLALSTGFYKYALTLSQLHATTPDAELTLVLNQISADLADDGLLQAPGFINDFIRAIRSLSPAEISQNLRSRAIVDYPAGLDVPNISRFLNMCAGALECAWRSGAALPEVSRGHGTTEFGGKLYVFGGLRPSDSPVPPGNFNGVPATAYKHAHVYDPVANSWTPLSLMPVGSYETEAHTIGNKIYVLAGYGVGGFRNELMEFDPQTNTWTQKAPSPTYRYEFVSEVVNDKIYVIGGHGTIDDGPWESGKDWSYKSHVAIYDPATNTWSTGQDAPVVFASAASCAFGSKIYVFGGRSGNTPPSSSTMEYDTATNSWTTKASAPVAREGHNCVRVNDQLYVLGGRDGSGHRDEVDRYDPATDTWTFVTRMPQARIWFEAAAIGGEIFIPGGEKETGGAADRLDVLNPLL